MFDSGSSGLRLLVSAIGCRTSTPFQDAARATGHAKIERAYATPPGLPGLGHFVELNCTRCPVPVLPAKSTGMRPTFARTFSVGGIAYSVKWFSRENLVVCEVKITCIRIAPSPALPGSGRVWLAMENRLDAWTK